MALEKPVEYAANGWSMAKSGARRAWDWLTYPWTWSATQTATFVDTGPVGQQLRNLDGRAQVHGAAIEIMSAQISDIARDHGRILALLERQKDVFERLDTSFDVLVESTQAATKNTSETMRFAAEVRNQLFESRSLPQELATTRAELDEGIRRIRQTVAEEAASVRSRLASLPSSEHVNTLMGQGNIGQELSSVRAQLSEEIQGIQRAFQAQSASGGVAPDEVATTQRELAEEIKRIHQALTEETAQVHSRLSGLPSTEEIHTLINAGIAQEFSSMRQQFAAEMQKTHEAFAQVTEGLHDRLSKLPTREQFHGLIDGGMREELATAKKQLFDEVTSVHEALARETARIHDKLQSALTAEVASTRVQLSGEVQNLHELLARETANVQTQIAALPSADQVQTLVGNNSVAGEIASTRTQLAEVLQKMHQVLTAQKAEIHERLAALPSTEQVHAFVEGGTANNIQSVRRMLTDETQRSHNAAERMTKKLEFLQSRSVIPLTVQGLVMCRNPMGFIAVPADDLATIASLADGVLPEPGAVKTIEKYLKPGGTFVDVGANVGVFSLLAANIVGPAGKVVAVEPAPGTARALRATVDANGLSNIVDVKEVAAGAEQGLGTLAVTTNTSQSTLLPNDDATGSVVTPIVPLDELLAGSSPDMIKIDVEGWEPKVIEGMGSVLNANPSTLIIMDFEPAHIRSTGLSAAGWVDRLQSAGLQIFEIDDRSGELSPLRKQGLEEISSINVLIARADPSRRVTSAGGDGWLKLGTSTLPS